MGEARPIPLSPVMTSASSSGSEEYGYSYSGSSSSSPEVQESAAPAAGSARLKADSKSVRKVLHSSSQDVNPLLSKRRGRLLNVYSEIHDEEVMQEVARLRREIREYGHVIPTMELDDTEK